MSRFFLIVTILVIFASVATSVQDLDPHWGNFKKLYNKTYGSGEEDRRRKVFEKHVNDIIHHNLEYDLGLQTYRKGLNQFADYTLKEFLKKLTGFKGEARSTSNSTYCSEATGTGKLPASLDWRTKGLVSPVRNQNPCGACWAFAAIGCLEGQVKKKTGKMVILSEQEIVDCAPTKNGVGRGCLGGTPNLAFDYIMKNHGINTEKCYPYVAKENGKCNAKPNCVGATITNYRNIKQGNENALQAAVANIGPIAVTIDSNGLEFYKGGIFSQTKKLNDPILNHCVLVIGYGTDRDMDYWLIKNSWGTSWGNKGYGRMIRNKNNAFNIATMASFPVV